MEDMILECREKALKKIWQNAWHMELMANPDLIKMNVDVGFHRIMDNYVMKTRCGYRYFFVTVNPRNEVGLEWFISKIAKMLKKVWIKKYMYCVEQRGDLENMGYGMHMHCLIEVGQYKRPAEVKRKIWNTFKNCCGNRQHVVVKASMEYENFVKYIQGEKKSEEKRTLVEVDKVWRRSVGLESIYGECPWLNC